MSDIDPTPETPVTLGDRMAWWRGDMAARLTTLEAQVAALAGTPAGTLTNVRSDLLAINTALFNLRSDIEQLRGPQERNLSQLYTAIYDGLYYQGEAANYPAHIRLNAELEDMSTRLDSLQAGVGAQPYESLELASVRGLLNALLVNASAGTYGLAPSQRPGDASSNGDAYIDGRIYAMFSDEPGTGITVSSNGYTLSGDWEGWSCYIQTADPAPLEGNELAPANRWYNLSGTGAKYWSVQQKYTIRVTLRPPLTIGFLDFVSSFVTLNSTASPRPAVVWGTSTSYETTNLSGTSFVWSENVGLIGNFRNAIISCNIDSENTFRIVTYNGPATSVVTNSVARGNSYTLNRDTTLLVIDNHTTRSLPFSGRIIFP